MLILRIKQAECALADGRLDEAFELARAEDVRKHRRGQDLVGQIARKLVERGREHLKADRLPQAGNDGERAAQIAGNLTEVAELRSAVATALLARQHAERQRAGMVAAARQQIAQGQLTLGAQLLGNASSDEGQTVTLLNDVTARRAIADAALTKAEEALKRDDWEGAVGELARIERAHGGDARLRELAARIRQLVLPRIHAAVNTGRLDVADGLLLRLERVAGQELEASQLRQTLRQCGLAWQAIERGNLREAEEIARRLAVILPQAPWIEPAMVRLRAAVQAIEELRAGPLSLVGTAAPDVRTQYSREQVNVNQNHPAPLVPVANGGGALPARFTISVDGVGAFQVLRGRKITIGPVSTAHPPDLALMADNSLPAVTLERDEGDYFLRSALPVAINDRPAISKLLANGDRLALSARCRMTFAIPSAASTTAILRLDSSRLPRGDVRNVILLDREIILGPGASAHIRADQLPQPAVLHVQDGRLYCQAGSEITINGAPAGRSAAIPIGVHVTIGTLSFVVTKD